MSFAADFAIVGLTDVLAESDLLVIATPHREYAGVEVDIAVIDVWNLLDHDERV